LKKKRGTKGGKKENPRGLLEEGRGAFKSSLARGEGTLRPKNKGKGGDYGGRKRDIRDETLN